MNAYLEGVDRERRAAERGDKRTRLARELRDAERVQGDLQAALDLEVDRVRKSKNYANNNLAGATWQSSLSQEMSAITQRYDIKIRLASEKAQRLRSELAALEAAG